MENENQKPNLSLADICGIQQEICNLNDCFSQCPFHKNGEDCIISNIDSIRLHADEIEAVCIEWEMNKPTIADKINEILKPYGMRLGAGNTWIWIDDDKLHTVEEVINKLTTTKWKGEPNG